MFYITVDNIQQTERIIFRESSSFRGLPNVSRYLQSHLRNPPWEIRECQCPRFASFLNTGNIFSSCVPVSQQEKNVVTRSSGSWRIFEIVPEISPKISPNLRIYAMQNRKNSPIPIRDTIEHPRGQRLGYRAETPFHANALELPNYADELLTPFHSFYHFTPVRSISRYKLAEWGSEFARRPNDERWLAQ